MAELTNK